MDLWLLLLVMSLATYRLTRLTVKDTFPPILWARDRLAGGWRPLTEPEMEKGLSGTDIGDTRQIYIRRAAWSPYWLAELVSCVWCSGGWISLVVTAGIWGAVGLPVPLLIWLAVWAAGSLLASRDWA